MARLKIDYGIDLGTTNSAVCRMEKGTPVIIKSDTLKDTMPSCVSINKKGGIRVGDAAYNDMKSDKRRATKKWAQEVSNTYVEFKRTMGTDNKYTSTHIGKDLSSEELSAEVLKTLKSFVTDENFGAVVITVPAKFTLSQKTATKEAAKLAGFTHCELLQEPIAASMAYGLSSDQKNGYWMVFDFGGGTFDAALLKVEDGIMQVFDTEGDNFLGGKDLDYAIVDSIIIPYIKENYSIEGILSNPAKKEVLRDAMKTYAEEVKNQLSFKDSEDIISNLGDLGEDEDGEEIELDLSVSQVEAFDAMRPHFQKAVDICKTLLSRNNMNGNSINKLILVGGPTHSPLIRQMLREQVTPNVDTSIDPMTAVATGAALYASTKDAEGVVDEPIPVGTIKLNVGYESTSVETTEFVTVILDKTGTGPQCPDKVWVELVSADKSWSSCKVEINEMGNVIEASLKEGRANNFSIVTYDNTGSTLDCTPTELTIIQGTKVGNAPLPYHIGIAVWDSNREKAVFLPLEGLEKNKPLPAIGVMNDRKTSSVLRPGVASDVLSIPVYQADNYKDGTSAYLYEYVSDVVINGTEVESVIPEGSAVEVTLKADSSEMMTMEVYFPAVDLTVTQPLGAKKKSLSDATARIPKDLADAQKNINRLSKEGVDVSDIQADLNRVKEEHNNSSEKKAVLQHVKEVLRKIEDKDTGSEWDRVEKELRNIFAELEKDQDKYGDAKTGQVVEQLRKQVDEVIRKKEVKTAIDLTELVRQMDFRLALVEYYVVWIYDWNRNFSQKAWKNSQRARQLVDQGISIINDNPSAEKLRPIVGQIIDLLPDSEKPNSGGLLS